mgnify:FL=1
MDRRNGPQKNPEPFDEEALAREFGEGESSSFDEGSAEQAGSAITPLDYIKLLHRTLDHPDFVLLPANQQLLYLNLLRHCQGNGQSRIRVAIGEMARWVGKTAKNVHLTRNHLIRAGLLRITVKPRQFAKGQYEVLLLKPRVETRLIPVEMAHRIDQFTSSDLSILEQQIRTMEGSVRSEVRADAKTVIHEFRRAGFEMGERAEEKVFRYLSYIRLTGRKRIEERFPDWTEY